MKAYAKLLDPTENHTMDVIERHANCDNPGPEIMGAIETGRQRSTVLALRNHT